MISSIRIAISLLFHPGQHDQPHVISTSQNIDYSPNTVQTSTLLLTAPARHPTSIMITLNIRPTNAISCYPIKLNQISRKLETRRLRHARSHQCRLQCRKPRLYVGCIEYDSIRNCEAQRS